MDTIAPDGAVVLLSGGQDSTTCLYWALKRWKKVTALTIVYGQRHVVEVDAAKKIAEDAGVPHEILELPKLLKGTSPLVNDNEEVGQYESAEDLPGGIEPTFVPCRNILFLTIAANRAACLGYSNIITGVCEEDYGGYPDCRSDFIGRMEDALVAGIWGAESDKNIMVHTPLMWLTKKASVDLAISLPGCMEALAYSHTCYNGSVPPCGKCHACLLRAKGFSDAGVADPLVERLAAV